MEASVLSILRGCAESWEAPAVPEDIPHGDMPGDKVQIGESHIQKARKLFPALCGELAKVLEQSESDKAVASVCGGSGVGKSEIASLLAWYFRQAGIGAYTLSGDNYPHRIPQQNDAERLRLFRQGGLHGLLDAGLYGQAKARLAELWEQERDADPSLRGELPWLAAYQAAGRRALEGYLGQSAEQDFRRLSAILAAFKAGEERLWLKRMGRGERELWYDQVDFSGVQILLVEWTHGNSAYLEGVDVPVFLYSTPEETRAHRLSRGRDGKADSPFTTLVLEIEQELLDSRAERAKLIAAKDGRLLDPADFRALAGRA